MAIEMGKKYRTRDGRDVRILCVDGPIVSFPVVGVIEGDRCLSTYNSKGMYSEYAETNFDLIEISPYSDIEIDAPGWARDIGTKALDREWTQRHFAGVSNDGRVQCWMCGLTSHTASGQIEYWDEFTTTKPEGVE